MKKLTLTMILALLMVQSLAANEILLRYQLNGIWQLTMEQEIYPGDFQEALAGRNFDMSFEITPFDEGQSANNNQAVIELTAIKGSYHAHGMNQRLPSSHIEGAKLNINGDGRSFDLNDAGPEVNLGQIVDGGLRPFEMLISLLPKLPEEAVEVGVAWETQKALRSVEGWAVASGVLHGRHEVTSIEVRSGTSLVTVESSASTEIAAPEGHSGFIGKGALEQTAVWVFDATNGQVISMEMEQEANGSNQLPQGEVQIRQTTRFQLNVKN